MGTQVVSRELTVKEEHAPAELSVLDVIARAAKDPSVNVEKMMQLMELQERIMAKQAEIEFNQALNRLLPKMPRIKRDGSVAYPADKNSPNGAKKEAFRFATYENIDKAIRPHLHDEGFSLSFESSVRPEAGGGIIVTGKLGHVRGHSRTASIPVALDTSGGKNNIQAMGSSLRYGIRYTTTMLLNIVTEGEDNDAQLPAQLIGEREVEQIYDLFTQCGMLTPESRVKFYTIAKVTKPEEIRADQYQGLVTMLINKSKAKK